jgi:hypothetical protein
MSETDSENFEWRLRNSVSLIGFLRKYWSKRKDQKNMRIWAKTGNNALIGNPICNLSAFFLQNAFFMKVKAIQISIWKDENPPSIFLEGPQGIVADDVVKAHLIEEVASTLRLLPSGWILKNGIGGSQEAIVELPHFNQTLVFQYFPLGVERVDIDKLLAETDALIAEPSAHVATPEKHKGEILRIEVR